MDDHAAVAINSRVTPGSIPCTFRDFIDQPDMLEEQVWTSLLNKAQQWSLVRW